MVYLTYFGKEYGLAKLGVVGLGIVVLGIGTHSYFNSAWVSSSIYTICDLLTNQNGTPVVELKSTCPSLLLEKVFVAVTVFCFTLSFLILLINTFSRQMDQGILKLTDIGFNGLSGILVVIGGSLYLYSAVSIENLFTELGKNSNLLPVNQTYQLYGEKVAAGALSLVQGLIYFVIAVLLFLR